MDKILKQDELWTKNLVTFVLKHIPYKKIHFYSKCLEISCNGIAWLSCWIAFIWVFNWESYYELQLNVLFGLILDIIIIAVLKAICRRRRPSVTTDMYTLGPDQFSFPSGHASRAIFLLMFFVVLHPVHALLRMPIVSWALSVCLSRILLSRHYILDVVGGMAVGVFEALVITLFWISQSTAANIINYVTNDYLPDGGEV
ncbi:polyisoprenoid diphosphate/phosphate phosphohydrolase PLPP6 isoform X3 [Eurosta solidaginis]